MQSEEVLVQVKEAVLRLKQTQQSSATPKALEDSISLGEEKPLARP